MPYQQRVRYCRGWGNDGPNPVDKRRKKEQHVNLITITKWQCEFCGKTLAGKSAMRKHEAYCMANPNRRCWMCEKWGHEPAPLVELQELVRESGVSEVFEASHWCPCCTFAAYRTQPDWGAQESFYDEPAWFGHFSYRRSLHQANSHFERVYWGDEYDPFGSPKSMKDLPIESRRTTIYPEGGSDVPLVLGE